MMKVWLALVLLAASAWAFEDTIEIGGETTEPAPDPEVIEGEIVKVELSKREPSGRSSKAVIGYPQPSFCPYENKVCPSAVTSTVNDAKDAVDCMTRCNKMKCAFFTHSGSTCGFAMGDASACGAAVKPADLVDQAGTDVYVRKFGVPDPARAHDKEGLSPQCQGGVGPVGLPEDDLSSHFCEAVGKYCPWENSDAYMYSFFAATVDQCKTRCTSYEACFMGVYVRRGPHEKRMCHMLSRACKPSELKDASEYRDENGNPVPFSPTTLHRLTIAEYRQMKKVTGDADPDNDESFCPTGMTYYEKDLGPGYVNEYCQYPTPVQCPLAAGNMYPKGQSKNLDDCLKLCLNYPTCGAVEYFQINDYNGNPINRCNVKDDPICTEEELKNTPAPAPYIFQQYISNAIPTRTYPVFLHFRRLTESDKGVCRGEFQPPPTKKQWSAKFCIHYDKVCPPSAEPTRSEVDATDPVDCLTKCYKSEGGNCKSAAYSGGKCTLIEGVCEEDELEQVLFKKYYYRLANIDAKCPPITCPENSSPQVVPMCPNTCKNPNGEKDCEFLTKRCVCDTDHLDQDGVCVRKEDCPVDDCPAAGPNKPFLVADTQSSSVWRFQNFDADDLGASCGQGATVQMSNPCINTCNEPDAKSDCVIAEPVKSCQCTDSSHLVDTETHLCLPPSQCGAQAEIVEK